MTPQAAVVVAEDGMNLGDGNWTWEAWVKPSGPGRWEFSMNDEGQELHGLTVSIDADVGCNIVPDGPLVFGRNNVVAFDAMRFGQWHHVACQRDGGSLTIFVDGYQKASGVIDVPVIARSAGRMGRMQTPPFYLGPVRFSKQARYAKDFTPLKRWTPDEDTILLYLVNRGIEEKTIIDEADGNNGGVIMGGVVASASDTPCADVGP